MNAYNCFESRWLPSWAAAHPGTGAFRHWCLSKTREQQLNNKSLFKNKKQLNQKGQLNNKRTAKWEKDSSPRKDSSMIKSIFKCCKPPAPSLHGHLSLSWGRGAEMGGEWLARVNLLLMLMNVTPRKLRAKCSLVWTYQRTAQQQRTAC